MRPLRFIAGIIIMIAVGVFLVLSQRVYSEDAVENASGVQDEQGIKREIIQDIKDGRDDRKNIRQDMQDIESRRQDLKRAVGDDDSERIHKKRSRLHHNIQKRKYDSHKFNRNRIEKRRDVRDARREKEKRYHSGPEPIRKRHHGAEK